MSVDRLRIKLEERFSTEAFPVLLDHLEAQGTIRRHGRLLALPDHAPRLSPAHESLWREIGPRFDGESRYRPPLVPTLALDTRQREDTLRGLLKRLARRGDLVEFAPDLFLLRGALEELEQSAREVAQATEGGWFGAAAFRDRIGGGRKIAILILEHFDRHGITLRRGDLRRMARASSRQR